MALAIAVALGSLPCLPVQAASSEVQGASVSILEYHDALSEKWRSAGGTTAEIGRSLHQLRNLPAMVDLVESLPPEQRPATILYLASGSHVAPLAICDTLPEERPCRVVLTEIDPTVRRPIERALDELTRAGCLSPPVSSTTDDGVSWRFRMGRRPVELELHLVDPEASPELVQPRLLESAELVISHDWSGEPLGNLQVIRMMLASLRTMEDPKPRLLMIEDLGAHPYPVDLSLFSPVAATSLPYGHRESDLGPASHGDRELGEPLFGGGVLLSFSDGWWRTADPPQVTAVFDLLLFSDFGYERQNVLSGGADPLIAPALLDWYSGFGYRSVSGASVRERTDHLAGVVRMAANAAREMSPSSQGRLACRLQTLRCLLQALVGGADIRPHLPAARFTRRPAPGRFPDPTMETMYRDAVRHAGDYRSAKERERLEAAGTVEVLESTGVRELLVSCPIDEPSDGETATAWLARYDRLVATAAADIRGSEPTPR
jgi:hypothetical protein